MILDKNNTYFDHLREVVKISVKHNLGKLRESVDPDSWEEHQVSKYLKRNGPKYIKYLYNKYLRVSTTLLFTSYFILGSCGSQRLLCSTNE
jgi:hypothetical protein